MRDLPRIAAKLYNEPWLIRSEVFAQICGQFEAARSGARMDAADPVGPSWRTWGGDLVFAHPQVQVVGSVAVIPVSGIIGKHLSELEMECGGYCLANLGRQLANVRDDASIRTAVIDFKTPGGIAIGVETAARQIRELSESGKRVIGYTDYDCCSAGYWLAAACDEIWAESSAMIGSVSTYIAGIDSSKAWEKEGYALKLFRTGDKKAIGMPGKEWTEEEERYIQAKTEQVDARFKGYVKTRRGLGDDLMQGQTWAAGDAPQGVVNGIVDTLEELVEAALEM